MYHVTAINYANTHTYFVLLCAFYTNSKGKQGQISSFTLEDYMEV